MLCMTYGGKSGTLGISVSQMPVWWQPDAPGLLGREKSTCQKMKTTIKTLPESTDERNARWMSA